MHCSDQFGVFHKYSLRVDTTTSSGLYARLLHAFLVSDKSGNYAYLLKTAECDRPLTDPLRKRLRRSPPIYTTVTPNRLLVGIDYTIVNRV